MADGTADPVIRGDLMDPPETRYVKGGDLHIAYQVVDSGALDLVFVAGFVSKSVGCTKLKAILDFNKEIEQRNIDGTPRMVDGRPVRAVMTLARWPDDALEVLREARDGSLWHPSKGQVIRIRRRTRKETSLWCPTP
jgi:hypothetical protein